MRLFIRYILLMIILELVLMIVFELNPTHAILISVISFIVFYTLHIILKSMHRQNLLNQKCDPEAFIEATLIRREEKMTGVPKSLIDLELTPGYLGLGEFEKAKDILESIDVEPFKKSATIMGMYYNNLMVSLIYLGKLDEARLIDENHIKPLDIKHKGLLASIRMTRAELLFHQGSYDGIKEIFEATYHNEKQLVTRLFALYFLAKMDEIEGLIDKAKHKYEEVALKANGLWIAKEAKDKLNSLNQSIS